MSSIYSKIGICQVRPCGALSITQRADENEPVTRRCRSCLVLVMAALVLSACGGPSAPSTSTTPGGGISVARAATAYLGAVRQYKAAAATFVARLHGNLDPTPDEVGAASGPMVAALRHMQAVLADTAWPSKAAPDARTLDLDVGPLLGDLDSVGEQRASSMSAWLQQFSRDGETVKSAADLLRHDLGLPSA